MGKIKDLAKIIGPGLVTGASDDDPSGIATYSQTGAQFGYKQLWSCLFTLPFMITIQLMCARIGFVTGRGLTGVLHEHYPRAILYCAVFLLVVANVINIGADLGSMASSAELLIKVPYLILLLIVAVACAALQVFIPYKTYVKYLKYLALTLLTYFAIVLVVKEDWIKILHATFVPYIQFNKVYLLNIVAILGTTISPYLFFWQSNEEVEERIEAKREQSLGIKVGHTTKKDLWGLGLDTTIGMIFSELIAFFIILTCATTLSTHGIQNINTADQAAKALKPIVGNSAFLLFAIGVIGAGLLAIPVLAGSTAYALCETFKWRAGLNKKASEAKIFYAVIIAATLIGVIINFSPIPPFKLLYYAAALNGVLAVPLMILIILIANNKEIMKKHVNSIYLNVLGWIITVVMGAGAIGLIYSLLIK